ncbi:MAG: aminodeoxychorismate synthase component I [Anaerolineae bacterium]|nr:aminodeoxychorismate synthase component I [Phycisphaerae bacterium]
MSSISVCDPVTRATTTFDALGKHQVSADPLDFLRQLERRVRAEPIQRFRSLGFLSYDLSRLFEPERMVDCRASGTNLPLFAFTAHSMPTSHLPALLEYDRAMPASEYAVRSTFTRTAYVDAVRRVLDYIRAGDVYQVNVSQRFTVPLTAQPYEIYCRLLERSPAPYAAYLDFADFALISNSPELLFKVTPDRKIITRPIKGTRPRGQGMERELLESKKDQAELAMIVDLERNDLGRICETGSVRVVEPRIIEAHPTVYHGVATIEGQLRDDVGFVDVLRAMFPCGSVTGAPKIRAMQIIDELEPVRRGPYCGAIGYIAADGSMEFNVAIRTMIVKDGLVHIPVGGGIVADSNPADEYEETLVKARAMFAALGIS